MILLHFFKNVSHYSALMKPCALEWVWVSFFFLYLSIRGVWQSAVWLSGFDETRWCNPQRGSLHVRALEGGKGSKRGWGGQMQKRIHHSSVDTLKNGHGVRLDSRFAYWGIIWQATSASKCRAGVVCSQVLPGKKNTLLQDKFLSSETRTSCCYCL